MDFSTFGFLIGSPYSVEVQPQLDTKLYISRNPTKEMYKMPLNHKQILTYLPKVKPYAVLDGHGLSIMVMPTGSRLWRYRYSFNGKPRQMALGDFEVVGLKEARERHMDARRQLSQGIDPAAKRKEQKQLLRYDPSTTFKEFATEWHTMHKKQWRSRHAENLWARLKADVFPSFGDVSVDKITSGQVVDAIKVIIARNSPDIARRTLQTCTRVFDYAIAKDRLANNPAEKCKLLLPKKVPTKHFAAIKSDQIPALLEKLNSYETPITLQTRLATKLLMLTFVRTKELTEATWNEFDLSDRLWLIPEARMKKGRDHFVPLSRQALELLRQLKSMAGNSLYLFPSRSRWTQPMSNNTILSGLKRMGYNGIMTGHGFRALAMTTIREKLRTPKDVIDLQLAHKIHDSSKPYDRSEFLEERTVMMQEWADYLDRVASA